MAITVSFPIYFLKHPQAGHAVAAVRGDPPR